MTRIRAFVPDLPDCDEPWAEAPEAETACATVDIDDDDDWLRRLMSGGRMTRERRV
jgi:hypothetical protein